MPPIDSIYSRVVRCGVSPNPMALLKDSLPKWRYSHAEPMALETLKTTYVSLGSMQLERGDQLCLMKTHLPFMG